MKQIHENMRNQQQKQNTNIYESIGKKNIGTIKSPTETETKSK